MVTRPSCGPAENSKMA
jgi:hypothetical protein